MTPVFAVQIGHSPFLPYSDATSEEAGSFLAYFAAAAPPSCPIPEAQGPPHNLRERLHPLQVEAAIFAGTPLYGRNAPPISDAAVEFVRLRCAWLFGGCLRASIHSIPAGACLRVEGGVKAVRARVLAKPAPFLSQPHQGSCQAAERLGSTLHRMAPGEYSQILFDPSRRRSPHPCVARDPSWLTPARPGATWAVRGGGAVQVLNGRRRKQRDSAARHEHAGCARVPQPTALTQSQDPTISARAPPLQAHPWAGGRAPLKGRPLRPPLAPATLAARAQSGSAAPRTGAPLPQRWGWASPAALPATWSLSSLSWDSPPRPPRPRRQSWGLCVSRPRCGLSPAKPRPNLCPWPLALGPWPLA